MNSKGLQTVAQLPKQPPKHCIFEYIYFSRPDSRIYDGNVDKMRRKLGKTLAEESPAPSADIVISVPDSSNTATIGYASRSGVKYDIGLSLTLPQERPKRTRILGISSVPKQANPGSVSVLLNIEGLGHPTGCIDFAIIEPFLKEERAWMRAPNYPPG